MRVRLLVRRHNLPDTAVLWAIEPSENPTISQLLEQVNEVIPLESGGDWGLEDYSVELKGTDTNFECLHFQLVRAILCDDDEVLIRPLLSHDIKLRKVSGRHQISSDGKHLFDGWVFGRPRPRGPVDRPAIEIPPRKRRRITYDEEKDGNPDEDLFTTEGEARLVSDPNGNRQLVLSADFEDDEEEDDEDFEPNPDEEEEEEGEEDEEGIEEEEETEDGDGNGNRHAFNKISNGSRKRAFANDLENDDECEGTPTRLRTASISPAVQKLREAFPKAPVSVCENVLSGCGKDAMKAWDTLSQAFKPSIPRKVMSKRPQDQNALRSANVHSTIKAASKNTRSSLVKHLTASNVHSHGGELPPADAESSLLLYYDHHGLPGGAISTGEALSHMAKIISSSHAEQTNETSVRNSTRKVSVSTDRSNKSVRFVEANARVEDSGLRAKDNSDESDDEDFDVESSIIESSISSDDTSDEPSDVDGTGSKNDDEATSSEASGTSSSASKSDSNSDSDSDSDVGPDEVSSKPANSKEAVAAPQTSFTVKSPLKNQNLRQNVTVPSGQGKNSTKHRNRRRRTRNLFQRYKNKGILPAGITAQEMEQLELDKVRTTKDSRQTGTQIQTDDSPNLKRPIEERVARGAEFQARRQRLLNSLASGGVEVGTQLFSESLKVTQSDSNIKQADLLKTMLVPEAAEAETPLTPYIDRGTEGIEAGAAECGEKSLTPVMVNTPIESSVNPSVEPTGSTETNSATRPRRKIDLGAAGRLLFGALGVRAPRNKADHEKVRNDLVKDIKPKKLVLTAEMADTGIDSSNADEDPEAWREVIHLRAVECCYDGVELSPAPFPFVQRWDPQQQSIYSNQGSRGGKGKRGQRNQPQYYDYEQQSSKKKKRDRKAYGAYYDSNEQHTTADAFGIENTSSHNEPSQMKSVKALDTQNVSSDGVEGAVNDQIMKDVQEAAITQVMDEDDLPRPPDDISMLPNFSESDVKPGMVIAFKQLILSEATKWQPQMSTYRTAVVIRASENGNLELRLAKRDRAQSEKYHDVETGERIYGKFDMPMDDDQDDEEDDGFLEVTVNEMVEPKVVQSASESLNASASSLVEAHNKASISADGSTTLGHVDSAEMSKTSIEEPLGTTEDTTGHQHIDVGDTEPPSIREGDLSPDDPDEMLSLVISEDTREEISVLIKEAGFRTSIPSSVLRAQSQLPTTPREAIVKGLYSPKSNWSEMSSESSPSQSIQAISSPSQFNRTEPVTEDTHDIIKSGEDALETQLAASDVQYPKLSFASSLASQVSDRGRQPDYPIPGADTLHQFDDLDSFLGVPEESPLNRDENLPCLRSVGIKGNSPLDHIGSSPSQYFAPPSSGGLPTPVEAFSTARSSLGPKPDAQSLLLQKTDVKDAKKIEDSYNREMEVLDAMLEETEDAEQIRPKALTDQRKKQLTTLAASQQESSNQFKIPPGSQQVDLTLSSDVDLGAEKENVSDDSYDDNYGLPRGPGWVAKKTRSTRRQTTGNSQVSSRRVTKTRASRRKTMTKF